MHTYQHPTDSARTVVTISKAEAKALLEFASADATRENLHGACVRVADDHKIEMVSTDGHTLLALRSAEPLASDRPSPIPVTIAQGYAIVPRDALARAAKSCGARESIVIAIEHVETVRAVLSCVPHAGVKGAGDPILAAPTSTASATCTDLQYPAIDQVLQSAPRRENEPTETGEALGAAIVGLNAEYLARLALVTSACETHKGQPNVRLSIARGEFRQARLAGDSSEWLSVHPVRADVQGYASSAIALIMPVRM